MPWLAIAAGAQLLGGIFGAKASKRAAKDAEALGRANADYIKQETAEQTRRLRFEQNRTRATTRAVVASSGFRSGKGSMGGSQAAYQKTLAQVQGSELSWLRRSGASRSAIALRGGQSQARQLKSQATGQLISGVATAASSIYKWKNS